MQVKYSEVGGDSVGDEKQNKRFPKEASCSVLASDEESKKR